MEHPSSCVFCKIVAKTSPCFSVYEDEQVFAFLDINPLHKGHTLVIPKEHYTYLHEVPAQVAASMMKVVPSLARALMKATGTTGWNIMQNNGSVAGQHRGVSRAHPHHTQNGRGLLELYMVGILRQRSFGTELNSKGNKATWANRCMWAVDKLVATEAESLAEKVAEELDGDNTH